MLQRVIVVCWLFGAVLTAADTLQYAPEIMDCTSNCSALSNITTLQLSRINITSVSLTDDFVLYVTFNEALNDSHSLNLTLFPDLQQLNVSHNGLMEFPHSLLKFPRWKTLDVSFNEIVELTEPLVTNCQTLWLQSNEIHRLSDNAFHHCPKLETLDLSNNKLEHIKLQTFSKLRHLSTLDLSKNHLETLDDPLTLPKLKSLDLSENLIKSIHKEVFTKSPLSLGQLNLSHNNLTHFPPDIFTRLYSLRSLSLQGNNLTNNIKFLQLPYHLQNLDLRDCSLEDIHPCWIKLLKDIKSLNLEENFLSCNCDLYSIIDMYPASVHIDTCNMAGKQMNVTRNESLHMKCSPQACDNWDLNPQRLDSASLNISTVVEKGTVRITWVTSLVVDHFLVSINSSNEKLLEAILRYEHEYSFNTHSAFITYLICVEAFDRNNKILANKCITITLADANIITGIAAGCLGLIPCIIGIIYVTFKDRNYKRLNLELYNSKAEEEKNTKSNGLPAKLVPALKEQDNKAFQNDHNNSVTTNGNSENPAATHVEIPVNSSNGQSTNF
ncbi:toll-like receptor 6 [Argonauta hians]